MARIRAATPPLAWIRTAAHRNRARPPLPQQSTLPQLGARVMAAIGGSVPRCLPPPRCSKLEAVTRLPPGRGHLPSCRCTGSTMDAPTPPPPEISAPTYGRDLLPTRGCVEQHLVLANA
ncbi:uncharacterized protein LOC119275995 [Triticum dicoccoides]|uniref:uncharacterized protein LOC119275995 n=1 Tax=Triticum dicoccoides TaxID=85692 RepID=UPI00188F816F|nr:uncharacterized protein LOC119275995 [Triticum dicoccoides]XP_044344614.1 uncharacterized protein LOC123065382 [Triticum aestivum]